MFVNCSNCEVKLKDENLTVGIILGITKNEALVKLTLRKNVNINTSRYQLYLHSKEELKRTLIEWSEIAPGFT